MSVYEFDDVLADSHITIESDSYSSEGVAAIEGRECTSLFLPGCSFLNYNPSLVSLLYKRLESTGDADGITLLCCGKILDFEEEEDIKSSFQIELVKRLLDRGVKRIVAACPNCVTELRMLLASHEEADDIEVIALPVLFREEGLTIDKDSVMQVVKKDEDQPLKDEHFLAIHDSCPDRKTGEFAESIRALFASELLVEMKHNRKNSFCCGSLANAFGKPNVAVSQAQKHGQEAVECKADTIVTYCMSCAHFLGTMQEDVPVHHYLEFVFNQHFDWRKTPPYLSMRFLFSETHGRRDFYGVLPSE